MNLSKKFYCTLFFVCMSVLGYAQTGFHKVGVGAEIALPMGNFGSAYGIGFGATGKAFYGLSEKADITGTLGYIHFGMKNVNNMMSGSMGMIPIMFGYRHDFGGLYAEPQLGLMMLRSKVTFEESGFGLSGMSGTYSTSKISFGLGGGYTFDDWDLGARLQIVDNLSFLAVRIGYNFSL